MVRMNCIDFFTSPPNFYILKKRINKTNFGGVLFLLYIIIMIFISLAYILDYIYNDKYEIEYNVVKCFQKYNFGFEDYPDIIYDFEIEVFLKEDEDISDSLILSDDFREYKGNYSSEITESGGKFNSIMYSFRRNVSEMSFELYYKCIEPNCSDFSYSRFKRLNLKRKDFRIDHTSSISLKILDDYDSNIIGFDFGDFHNNSKFFLDFEWTTIIYKEKNEYQKYLIKYLISRILILVDILKKMKLLF